MTLNVYVFTLIAVRLDTTLQGKHIYRSPKKTCVHPGLNLRFCLLLYCIVSQSLVKGSWLQLQWFYHYFIPHISEQSEGLYNKKFLPSIKYSLINSE